MHTLYLHKSKTYQYAIITGLILISCLCMISIGATDLFVGGAKAMEEGSTQIVELLKKAFWLALLIDALCVIFKHDPKAIAKELTAAGIAIAVRILVGLYESKVLDATIDLIISWFGGSAGVITVLHSSLSVFLS